MAERRAHGIATSKDDRSAISTRLREARLRFGWSQRQLAERGGLRRSEIVKIETGNSIASSVRMRQGLAQAFGVPLPMMGNYLEGSLRLDAFASVAQRGKWAAVVRVIRGLVELGYDPRAVTDVVEELAEESLDEVRLALRAKDALDILQSGIRQVQRPGASDAFPERTERSYSMSAHNSGELAVCQSGRISVDSPRESAAAWEDCVAGSPQGQRAE